MQSIPETHHHATHQRAELTAAVRQKIVEMLK